MTPEQQLAEITAALARYKVHCADPTKRADIAAEGFVAMVESILLQPPTASQPPAA